MISNQINHLQLQLQKAKPKQCDDNNSRFIGNSISKYRINKLKFRKDMYQKTIIIHNKCHDAKVSSKCIRVNRLLTDPTKASSFECNLHHILLVLVKH